MAIEARSISSRHLSSYRKLRNLSAIRCTSILALVAYALQNSKKVAPSLKPVTPVESLRSTVQLSSYHIKIHHGLRQR